MDELAITLTATWWRLIAPQAPPPRSSEGELELQRGGARALAPPIWLCSEYHLASCSLYKSVVQLLQQTTDTDSSFYIL
ncbi:hypothetical protein QQF64_031342 [Cirrhinus molitorella]|uniref:Uncharacterized protein n=1 Tax=Cirrhinus molitorella TaxID=172907 RepID=A0ABR3MWN3_9TELE